MKIKSAVITMVLLAGIVLAGCRKQAATSSTSSATKTESSKDSSSAPKKKEAKVEKLSTSQIFNKYFADKTLVSKISETSIIDIEHTTDRGYTFTGKHRENGMWVDDGNGLDNCTFKIRDKTVIITGDKVGAKSESPVELLINFDGTITNVKTQNDYLVLDRTVANYEGNPNIASNDVDTQLTQDTLGKSSSTPNTNTQTKSHYSSKSATSATTDENNASSEKGGQGSTGNSSNHATNNDQNSGQSSNTDNSGAAHQSTQPSQPQTSSNDNHSNNGNNSNGAATSEPQNKTATPKAN